MKEMPANQLDPRVKNVWRINDAIWIVLLFACLAVGPAIMMASRATASLGCTLLLAVGICFVVVLVVWLVVLPPIRYARWRYQVSEDYLDIAKGIIWRKRYTIPFIRVQKTSQRGLSGASATPSRSFACRTPIRAKGPFCARSAWPA